MVAKFSFYKAGQGSFYGGRIWHHELNKVFTVVYDCGTSSFIAGNKQSLNNEITYFKHRPNYFQHNDEIELLFISHLDFDHVSGLKRLLTEFKVKNIILPYIEKEYRQFFLVSFSEDADTDDSFSLEDYTLFIETPIQFILQNSENTKIYLVKPDGKTEIEYQSYDGNQSEFVYPKGTPASDIEELNNQQNVSVYENNLQFFIRQNWEFTTYVKGVNKEAIKKLHECLNKRLKKKTDDVLSFDDLKNIVTTNRKEARKCYTENIGEINAHGLVLLHGPINFNHLFGRINSDCELNNYYNGYRYNRDLYHEYFRNVNQILLGTLLLGDTSLRGENKIEFPTNFKDKLGNVHVIQVPHHGSIENWDYEEFKALNIGSNIKSWENHIVTVCNFGYGNKYGHPSHKVLNDLRSTIFLNTQFSRLNIKYDFIDYN